jgi:hypothetical protein
VRALEEKPASFAARGFAWFTVGLFESGSEAVHVGIARFYFPYDLIRL